IPAANRGAALSVGADATGAGSLRRAQRLARYLRPDEHGEAALLQPTDARKARRPFSLPRPGDRPGAGEAPAPAEPPALLRRSDHAAGATAGVEGGPRGDALVGRDALPVPRRGGVRVPGAVAPALEAAPLPRKIHSAASGGALAAAVDRVAAQGD